MTVFLSPAQTAVLAKCEGVSLDPSVQEFNREGVRPDVARWLADQLVKALGGYDAGARGVRVGAVAGAGIGAVEAYAEANGFAAGARAQHQVQIARLES